MLFSIVRFLGSGILKKNLRFHSSCCICYKCIQRDLEAGIPVWVPKLGTQKSFLVRYTLSSIHSDKSFANTQGLHGLKKHMTVC